MNWFVIIRNAILPALEAAARNPAVQAKILELLSNVLARAELQAAGPGQAHRFSAMSPLDGPEGPHDEWNPKKVMEWASEQAHD